MRAAREQEPLLQDEKHEQLRSLENEQEHGLLQGKELCPTEAQR